MRRTAVEAAVLEVLENLGGLAKPGNTDLAVAGILEATAYWDDEHVAAYVGVGVRSVRPWCWRQEVARRPLTRAADVIAQKAMMPGRGAQGRPRARKAS